MNPLGKVHLYTIWNPALSEQTIEEHIRTLTNEGFVKWLILYDDEIAFKDTLNSETIRRLNLQVEKKETLLFIQCLNIFFKSLYVARIEKIEKIPAKNIDRNDQFIPEYYRTARILLKKLQAYYAITLSDIREIGLDEIPNLVPSVPFKSAKFNYPFPCLIRQKNPRSFFEKPGIDEFNKIEIVHEYIKGLKKKRCIVIRPKSVFNKEPLNLEPREFQFLKLLAQRHPAGAKLITISKELGIKIQNVYNLKSKIDRLFKNYYGKPLMLSAGGTYKLKTSNIYIKEINSS
jgi:hypothetical protein